MPDPPPAAGLAARVRAGRAAAGWSQEELAARAGYSDRLIRKLEGGGTVRARTLADVLRALDPASPCPACGRPFDRCG